MGHSQNKIEKKQQMRAYVVFLVLPLNVLIVP